MSLKKKKRKRSQSNQNNTTLVPATLPAILFSFPLVPLLSLTLSLAGGAPCGGADSAVQVSSSPAAASEVGAPLLIGSLFLHSRREWLVLENLYISEMIISLCSKETNAGSLTKPEKIQ